MANSAYTELYLIYREYQDFEIYEYDAILIVPTEEKADELCKRLQRWHDLWWDVRSTSTMTLEDITNPIVVKGMAELRRYCPEYFTDIWPKPFDRCSQYGHRPIQFDTPT